MYICNLPNNYTFFKGAFKKNVYVNLFKYDSNDFNYAEKKSQFADFKQKQHFYNGKSSVYTLCRLRRAYLSLHLTTLNHHMNLQTSTHSTKSVLAFNEPNAARNLVWMPRSWKRHSQLKTMSVKMISTKHCIDKSSYKSSLKLPGWLSPCGIDSEHLINYNAYHVQSMKSSS